MFFFQNDSTELQRSETVKTEKIGKEAKEQILSEPRLRQNVIVEEIIDLTSEIISQRKINGSSFHKVKALIERYHTESEVG